MDSNHGPRPYQGRALTKLSYTPIAPKQRKGEYLAHLLGVHGLEPWTSSLSGTRSNQTELHARAK